MCHTLRPPAATHGGEFSGGEGGLLETLIHAIGILPGKKDLRGRTRIHRELTSHWHGVAKAGGSLCGGDAYPEVALAAEQLDGFAGDIAETSEDGPSGSQKSILASRGGEFAEARSEDEAPLHVTCDEPMVFEGNRKSVCGWSGQSRPSHEARKRRRPGFERSQNECGFVQNADSASIVHTLILPYRIVLSLIHI